MSVPAYKVNPQTGDVVKDDGTGWKPVASARNKQTGQIVIDEGSGWKQLVRSPDGGWSLAGNTPTNPQASDAAVRARGAMDAGLPIDTNDLKTLTRPNFQPLTPAQQAYAETPQARLENQQVFDERNRELEASRVPDSNLKERTLMAMNGPSLGNAPRIAAGAQTVGALLATPFTQGDIIDRKGVGGATQQFLEDARVHQRRAREERPAESLALEIVPGLFQGKSLLDIAGKHVLKKGTALNNIARAMGVGAVGGATYMGSQNESGKPLNALEDAGKGALYGAAGGAAFKVGEMPARVAYRSAKTGIASISDALSAAMGRVGTARDRVADQVAIAAVNRSADRAGLTMDQMLELVKKYEGKPAVLAEVIGQDAINALTALTRGLGKTSQKAQDIIEERTYGWYDRAKGDIEEATGFAPGQVDQIVEEGMQAGREKARPFYEQLFNDFKAPSSFPESLKRVNRLLRSPGMERHKALAEDAIRNAAAKRGIPISKMSKMEYFDLIKQSLDDAIEGAMAKGENRTRVGESVRDLTELKDEFVKELDRLTDGAYAAARDAGGEAPRLRQASIEGQKAFGARNPRVVEETVQGTTEEALPALQAGMVDDLATRIDKGSLIPGRFRRPDVAGKVKAVFGEEAGSKIIEKMDAEATLRETGSRWAPRMNSVTGTVMDSGPTQLGDDLVNAGMNLLTGNKLGLFRQAINFARQRGFSQRQLDSIGDLLLSDPAEGLRKLGRMRPDGAPGLGGNAARGQNALAQPNDPMGTVLNQPSTPMRSAGFNLQRPQGFNDDIPRGTQRFRDERLTDGQNKAVEMARNGYSNDEIAEELAASMATVKTWLSRARSMGVDVPKARNAPPPTAVETLYPRFEKGQSDQQIAQITGMNPRTVASHRVRFNKARRAAGEKPISSIHWRNAGGIGEDVQSSLMLGLAGNAGGDTAGRFIDLNQDGVVDEKDRELGRKAGSMAAGVPLASRMARGYANGLNQSVRRSVRQAPYESIGRAANDAAPYRPLRKVALEPMPAEDARDFIMMLKGEKDLSVVARDLGMDISPGRLAARDATGQRLRDMVERERAEALKVANESIREARGWNSMGVGKPRNPMRAELPGSPEYQRAVAKGLDMSQPARMQRAQDMGFDTGTVLYHGTATPFSEGKGIIWGSTNPDLANDYAAMRGHMNARDRAAGKSVTENQGLVKALVARREKTFDADLMPKTVTAPEFLTTVLEQSGKNFSEAETARLRGLFDTVRKARLREESGPHYGRHDFWYEPETLFGKDGAKAITEIFDMAGFDSIKMIEDGQVTYGIRNPANIRSVNAAFDPDMAASPMLTAGVGGKRPPKPPPIPGAGTGPKNRKHLGRGLRDLTDDNVIPMPQRKPASMGEGRTPEQLAEPFGGKPPSQWTPEEREFFVNSGHGSTADLDGGFTRQYQTVDEVKKSLGRKGMKRANQGNQYEDEGFPVIGSMIGGTAAVVGGAGIAALLNRKPPSNVPPGLAKAREQAAAEVANLYQNNPNSREFQVAVIRLQQIDREIELMKSGNPMATALMPPSRKPVAMTQ